MLREFESLAQVTALSKAKIEKGFSAGDLAPWFLVGGDGATSSHLSMSRDMLGCKDGGDWGRVCCYWYLMGGGQGFD